MMLRRFGGGEGKRDSRESGTDYKSRMDSRGGEREAFPAAVERTKRAHGGGEMRGRDDQLTLARAREATDD